MRLLHRAGRKDDQESNPRHPRQTPPLNYVIQWRLSGNPFLTAKGALIDAAHAAIKTVTGCDTLDDTGGGTSDGRFVATTGAEVIELGSLNESIHKINENVGLQDLEILSRIYERMLINLLVQR